MYRSSLLALAALLISSAVGRADEFDRLVNASLAKAAESADARPLERLTPKEVLQHAGVIPGTAGAVVVVKTNEGRWAKLAVQSGRQKLGAERSIPMLLVNRFVTYKPGEERTVQAAGNNVALFPGFRLSLDLGQVVPEELGGDLRFVASESAVHAEPVGKARLFILTGPVRGAAPEKAERFTPGEGFEPRYFNGTFKLHDDGRRSGTLKLEVTPDGGVTGAFYSDKDGKRYDVQGKLGNPAHSIRFTIVFPRTEQVFQGMLFTGDAKALAGTSRVADREAAFYALRVEN